MAFKPHIRCVWFRTSDVFGVEVVEVRAIIVAPYALSGHLEPQRLEAKVGVLSPLGMTRVEQRGAVWGNLS
jgi:hypothetical protein